jgi:uncharacterized protein DUF4150
MSLQTASKSADAIVVCEAPDVCWTPMGSQMVAVPYMIIARLEKAENTAKKYLVNDKPAFTMASRIPTVEGDEAGTGGGIISGVNCGWCRPIEHSTTFQAEGHWLVREGDLVAMNCDGPEGVANTYGRVVIMSLLAAMKPVSLKKGEATYTDEETGATVTEKREVLKDPKTNAVIEIAQRATTDPATGKVTVERVAVTTMPDGRRSFEAASGSFDPVTEMFTWKATAGDLPQSEDGFDPELMGVDDDGRVYLPGEDEAYTPPPPAPEPDDVADDDPELLDDPELKEALADQAAAEAEVAALERQQMWEAAKIGVDIAGTLDPSPLSDVIGAGMSAADGDYIGAGLSIMAIFPYVGDAIAKPIKGTRAARQLAKLLDKLRKAKTKSAAMVQAVKKARERVKALIKKKRTRKAAGLPEIPRPKKGADGGFTPKGEAGTGRGNPVMPRSVGAAANDFRGPKVTKELAEALGMDRRRLGQAVHGIKKAAGLGGADNVVINRATGDVFDPRTQEYIGNIFDEVWK